MSQPRPCLWKHGHPDDNNNGAASEEEKISDLLQRYSTKPSSRKSLFALCANSLAVGQELALTCLFLARHQVALLEEDRSSPLGYKQQQKVAISMVLVLMTFIVVIVSSSTKSNFLQERKTKIRHRLKDSLLLGILLRFLSAVLRTLTESFSSDTVQALAYAGMVIHLFACDYLYASGKNEEQSTTVSAMSKSETSAASPPTSTTTTATTTQRPTFRGGAVSLNAAFFSTTLLASRLSSNVTVYFFVTSAVVLFAFYPASRHAIFSQHSFHVAAAIQLFITFLLSVAAYLCFLDQVVLKLFFISFLILICVFVPVWKYWLQRYKRVISGPWDIIPASQMMLDG